MKKMLSGLFALAVGAVLIAGCGESPTSDRLGEQPGDRAPSASPRTTPPPPDSTKTTPPAASPSTQTPPPTTPPPGGTK